MVRNTGKKSENIENTENIKNTEAVNTQEKSYEEYYNEKVPVMLIKDNAKYKDDVTVTVNGVNYQIRRGVQLMVPRKVALVLERANEQEAEAQAYMDSLKG